MTLVVDASVTIAWLAEDERSDYAESALAAIGTDFAFVPAIWHWEISNTLLVLERKGRIVDALTMYAQVIRLPINIDNFPFANSESALSELRLARKYNLSIYDAAYLALAISSFHPLATLDRKLANAAQAENIYFGSR